MPLTHHPLVQEFPKFKDHIHTLKAQDRHFHRLMDQYEEIDKKIYRIESGEEPTSDDYVETLRKTRLQLKDELYTLLTR